jgi:hypothetical protein
MTAPVEWKLDTTDKHHGAPVSDAAEAGKPIGLHQSNRQKNGPMNGSYT